MSQKKKKIIPSSVEVPRYRIIFSSIIMCAVMLSVFAVRLHIEKLTGHSLDVFANTDGLYADWFLYCKEIVCFVIACVICLYSVGERIFPDSPYNGGRLFSKKAIFPVSCIGVYLIFACLSSLFSKNKEVVLLGVCTEFEGLLAVFSYCVIFLFGLVFINGKKICSIFRWSLISLTALTGILAVFEYTVSPLMELSFMKYLIAPEKYRAAAETLKIGNDFRESVLTFYNSNYTGEFFALLFPVSVYAVFAAKKTVSRILAGLLAAVAFAACVMTNATASFYVVLAELIVLIIFFAAKKIIPVKPLLIVVASFAFLAICLDLFTGRDFTNNIIKSMTNSGTYESSRTVYTLEKAEIRGRELYISADGSGYTIKPPYESGETLTAVSDTGEKYAAEESDRTHLLIYDDALDTNINIVLVEGIMYLDLGYDSSIDLAVTTDGLKLIAQNRSLLSEIPVAPMADSSLTRFYGLATGRGYIWINSFPILKQCLIIGKGPGNFPFSFVQNDVVGLSNTDGTYHLVVDKPHSRYFQIALTCGIPALAAVIVMFAAFLISGGKSALRWNKEDLLSDKNRIFFICLCASIVGFFVEGIVNDGTITVEPLFWLIFGSAFGMLQDLKKEASNA